MSQDQQPKPRFQLNLGRLQDALRVNVLYARNVYFALIENVEVKDGKKPGSKMLHWKLRLLDDGILDQEGNPVTQKKNYLFVSYSAVQTPNYNPDVTTRQIVEAVSEEAATKWNETNSIFDEDVVGTVVKVTVGIEAAKPNKDDPNKPYPARNNVEEWHRLTDEEAAAIQVPQD